MSFSINLRFLLGWLLSWPLVALAQKGVPAPTGPAKLQPLYGNLAPAQAQQAVGAATLKSIDQSFASRLEASKFFSQKGFEYLQEGQLDTATVRFNLAYVLNPQNPDAYRGLAVVLSQRPDTNPEVLGALLLRGLAVAPTNGPLLTDATTIALSRYEKSKKKKDLQQANDYSQRALLADSTNAATWQNQARIRFYQEDYPGAWQAVHKAQGLSLGALDFQFLTELLTKAPDPEGKFK